MSSRETNARIDLQRAVLGLSPSQAVWIGARFEDPEASESETAESLGWTITQAETVSRSLRPDRKAGRLLRQRLSIYKKNQRREKKVVRESPTSMPLSDMSKPQLTIVIQTAAGPMTVAGTDDQRLVRACMRRAIADAEQRARKMGGSNSVVQAAAQAETKRLQDTLAAIEAQPKRLTSGLIEACKRRVAAKSKA